MKVNNLRKLDYSLAVCRDLKSDIYQPNSYVIYLVRTLSLEVISIIHQNQIHLLVLSVMIVCTLVAVAYQNRHISQYCA